MYQAEKKYPMDKVYSYEELMTQQLNEWRDILVDRTLSLHEAILRRSENPEAMIKVQDVQRYPMGMSINEIISVRIPAVAEARAHVRTLEAMIKELANGNFEKRFSDEFLVDPKASVAVIDKKDLL